VEVVAEVVAVSDIDLFSEQSRPESRRIALNQAGVRCDTPQGMHLPQGIGALS
jgi:hypothetical protein